MLRHHLKLFFRSIGKWNSYTLINLIGLTVGLACFLLIFIHIKDEISYDEHYVNEQRIYRIVQDAIDDLGVLVKQANTYPALVPALQERNYTDIEKYLRIYPTQGEFKNTEQNKQYLENKVAFADSTFFSFFDYPVLGGDVQTALNEPFSIVLGKDAALKYFGHTDVLNKSLTFLNEEGSYVYTIKGVIDKDFGNSHIDFDFILSMNSLKTAMPWFESWRYPPVYSYFMLRDNGNIANFSNQLDEFAKASIPGRNSQDLSYTLQPLSRIHLYSQRENEILPGGSVVYVWIFIGISILILLISCINFINLAIAGFTERAKEIGILKTIGAKRKELVFRFILESSLLTLVALICAISIAIYAKPNVEHILGKELPIKILMEPTSLLLIFTLLLVVSLINGIYPALIISSIKPHAALKGVGFGLNNSSFRLRYVLVVGQFFISSVLISCVIISKNQLNFLQNRNLGFKKDHIVTVYLRDHKDQINSGRLKEAWMQHPNVLSITGTSGVPTSEGIHDFLIKPSGSEYDSLYMNTLMVDHDFTETYGVNIVEGRDFSKEYITDATHGFILNESAVKKLGWENPIGKELSMFYYLGGEKEKKGKVVGVIQDFNYHSLHQQVDPLVLYILEKTYYTDYLSIKVNAANISETIDFLERKWKDFNPDRVFDFGFLDDTLGQLYQSEKNFGNLFQLFAILAIAIACIGLFGLSSLVLKQRTKEVGIRKVLGATKQQIIALLSYQFSRQVFVGFFLSIPVTLWFMYQWLSNFAYRITIGYQIFLVAGMVTIIMSLLTISLHVFRTMNSKPIDVLKDE